jgi:hypothetical protein
MLYEYEYSENSTSLRGSNLGLRPFLQLWFARLSQTTNKPRLCQRSVYTVWLEYKGESNLLIRHNTSTTP